MPSITDGLYLAQRALYAQQFGLQVTQQNIANVNTAGYSRQRVEFVPGNPPVELKQTQAGTGVDSVLVDSFRNRFIDFRVNQELQGQGEQNAILSALQQVEAVLNESGGRGLQGALSDFFNSFSALANTPEDLALRQDVVSRGQALVREFRRESDRIQSVQMAENRAVVDTVKEINTVTADIARLNVRVAQLQNSHSQEEGIFRDQRQELLDRLAGLVDVSYFETESGAFTVMTKQGALLVAGDRNQQMQTVPSPDGSLLQVEVDGVNITSKIESGKLGGLLKVRDTTLAGYLTTLDDMAATLIGRVNQQHALGSDFNGQGGGDFFVPFVQTIPGSNAGAARTMAMAVTDPKLVAAAAAGGGVGDNANALLLAGIKDEKLFASGTTASQVYAGLVFKIGSDLRDADNLAKTQDQVLTQLQNQRDSISGVNMDEEAINIIRFQKAYEASARFVQVINTLTDEIVHLLGS